MIFLSLFICMCIKVRSGASNTVNLLKFGLSSYKIPLSKMQKLEEKRIVQRETIVQL